MSEKIRLRFRRFTEGASSEQMDRTPWEPALQVGLDRLDEILARANAEFGDPRQIGGPKLPEVRRA